MRASLVLTSVLAIFLAACGGEGSGSGSAIAAVTTPKPVVDFSPAFLSLVVGTYSGACYDSSLLIAPLDTALTLTPDFLAKSLGISGSVQGLDVHLGATRKFDASGPIEANFSIVGKGVSLMLEASATGRGIATAYGSDSTTVYCNNVPATAKLMTNSIYAALAKYLDSTKKDIPCTSGVMSYQVQDGIAKIGDQSYSLYTGLKEEFVGIPPILSDNTGLLTYMSTALDGSQFILLLDHYGDFSNVTLISKTGVMTSCGPKKK
jgi:hypothetical protein